MSKHPQFRSFSPELAYILSDVIDIYNRHQIPNWRNERFTKDGSQLHKIEDLRPDLEVKLSLFRQHFAACDAAYSQINLSTMSKGKTVELHGKDVLKELCDDQTELFMDIGDLRYALWPYFMLQEGQIYVFDSHDIRRDRTLFVNYTSGKQLIFKGQQPPNPLFTQLYEQTDKSEESHKSFAGPGSSHSSHNDSTALLYAIENKFPYPIARAFYQLRHIHDWKAQIPQLANILGLLLQHIAMIALAEYLSGEFRDEKLNQELLRAFKDPVTHGAWLKIADRLLKLLRQRQHQMFMPELLEFYCPERGEATLTSLKTMSGELVQMRNFLLKRIPEFSPARREYERFKHQVLTLLQSLKFLADYPLISVEHTQTQDGVKIHICYRHIGFHDSFACATLQSELDFDRMLPALLNLRTAEVLYMYPLYALKTSEVETPPLLLLRFGVFDSAKQCIRYATIKEKHSDEQAAMKKGEEHHQEGLAFWALLQGRSLLTLRRKASHCYLEGGDVWQKRAVGDVIAGRYEILEHLRRGGMADVYKVKDRRNGTLRALKLLPFQFLNDYTILQRFRSEASEARQLTHENITQVLDAGETLADHYLVMELATGWNIAEGQTAIDVSELPRPVPEQTVLSIARQTCEALEYIHRQPGRLVHRDIKPGNLLLFEDGRVKITDFGIARSREALKLTLTGLPIGTPEYMSPEQAQGERELTPASDLYSLGTVMYELLAGQTPFRSKTALQTMYAIVHDPVPPLRKLNPAVPKALEQIVMTCLQKTPQERFQSAQQLYEALQTYHRDKESRMWEDEDMPINDTDVEQAEIFRKTKETAILIILFLDIVQSTQLREELGEIRFETVLREKKQIFTTIIERDHKGRVIKDLGDGLLAVFAVADLAVQRALEIQETLVSDSLCKVRVGLDMGQVTQDIERGIVKDVFGRHVNRAARLEELGSGGHILTSYTVWDNAENWLKHLEQIRWKKHGCYRLKGIRPRKKCMNPTIAV